MLSNAKLHGDGPSWRTGVLTLAAVVLCGLSANGHARAQAADQAVEQAPAANEDPSAIDLTYIAADAVAIKVVRPAAILGRPEFDAFRKLVDQAMELVAGLEIGLDKLEQVTWMALGPRENAEGDHPDPSELVVLILQASEPHDFAGFINRWIDDAAQKEFQGRTYSVGKAAGRSIAYFWPDERTAILGSEDALCRVMAAPSGRRPEFLSPEVVAEFKDDHLLVAGWSAVIHFILKWPELALARTAVAPLAPIWMNTNSFAYGLRLEDRLHEHAIVFGKDEQGALKVEETIRALLILSRNTAEGLREPTEGLPPLIQSLQAIAVDVLDDVVSNAQLERSGTVVRVKTWTDASILGGKRAKRPSAAPARN